MYDFVQFDKQHSRCKAILPSITLSQHSVVCEIYFIPLTVVKPLRDLTSECYLNHPGSALGEITVVRP